MGKKNPLNEFVSWYEYKNTVAKNEIYLNCSRCWWCCCHCEAPANFTLIHVSLVYKHENCHLFRLRDQKLMHFRCLDPKKKDTNCVLHIWHCLRIHQVVYTLAHVGWVKTRRALEPGKQVKYANITPAYSELQLIFALDLNANWPFEYTNLPLCCTARRTYWGHTRRERYICTNINCKTTLEANASHFSTKINVATIQVWLGSVFFFLCTHMSMQTVAVSFMLSFSHSSPLIAFYSAYSALSHCHLTPIARSLSHTTLRCNQHTKPNLWLFECVLQGSIQ